MTIRLFLSLFLACVFLLPSGAVARTAKAVSEETETPPVFSARAILPEKILSGSNYAVDDKVANDGYMNLYVIHTPKGDLHVESTSLLYARIKELQAAAAMDDVNKGAEIGKSIGQSGVNAVKGVFNLLTKPGETLSSVGKSFTRAQASSKEQRPSDDKGTVGELLGYNKAMRQYAKAYGVDPYSRNPVLQESLKRLAGAGFFGSFTATAAIPGGAALVAFSQTGAPASAVDVSIPPEDLFTANRERLKAMGATADMADLLVENTHYTPIEQTRLVLALDRMTKVADRTVFIHQAILADSDDMAWFRTRQAELYANLNATTDKVARFVRADKYIAAVTADNGLLVAYPLDYLAWTPTMAGIARTVGASAAALKVKSKKLVVSGEVSPLAGRMLKAAGFGVVALREGLR
ncbi:hypothetical protein [Solidesulfovibrio sp.]|jgi:hypothetical protein|uniref:hypothetical protein n=1 Tax=Solidesulfovibrio sp. TaxID=2910990 RepID=UPI000EE882BD|nr:hypothetical protein [Solidesulfovibrio sp.]MEA5087572.1 hypothetical protein [Solidesulfovibrio sp.]HCR12365.1 hypothetical protein [Desulfovibrio sp.]HML61935.1 hypothetical protein [Solidesulfovibrio sp.]